MLGGLPGAGCSNALLGRALTNRRVVVLSDRHATWRPRQRLWNPTAAAWGRGSNANLWAATLPFRATASADRLRRVGGVVRSARVQDPRGAWAEIRPAPGAFVRFDQWAGSGVEVPPPPSSLFQGAERRDGPILRSPNGSELRAIVNPPPAGLQLPGLCHLQVLRQGSHLFDRTPVQKH